jgi:putative ABC transport system permease protein
MKFWRRKQEQCELDEELRFHLEQEEQLRRDRGQDPATALRDFGNLALVAENTRETWGWAALDRTVRDARFALRLLRKSPAFALTAIGVLALGIGATTAIFSVVNAVLLRPLGFHDPDRLVMVWEKRLPEGHINVIQTQNFLDWRERNHAFSAISCLYGLSMNLSGDGDPVQLPGLRASTGFFEILGVTPVMGRVFTAEDDRMGAPPVAILSYGLWQSRYGGSARILGQKILLEGNATEVIGVMPPEFAFPTIRAQIYAPIRLDPATAPRDGRNYQAVARLKTGVSMAKAQREMEAIAAQTARERPRMNTNWSAAVIPLLEQTVGKSRDMLLVLLAAVLFVLLISCANVSNLLLMRAAGRQREMTVRAALGAGRWRLVHQTAVESLLLAMIGGLLGFLFAYWCVPAAIRMLPENYPLPRRAEIAVDSGVLWFSIAVSVACGMFFGIFPALQVNRAHLAEGLKQGGRTGSGAGRGFRNALVVAEVAVAVVLVVGAGLMLRSFVLLNGVNMGFQPDHLLTLRMMLIFNKYAGDIPRRSAIVADTLDKLRALPQVQSASSIHVLPMMGTNSGSDYNRADRPAPAPGAGTGGEVSVISDDYFHTMGIPLIAGREFDRRTDRFGKPGVAILNRAAAAMLFPGENPLGKRLSIFWSFVTNAEIVGIAENMRHDSLDTAPQPTLYVCNLQAPSLFASLVVRTRGNPMTAVAAVKEAMRQVDPDQGTAEIQSMEQMVSSSVAVPRLQTVLLGAFGALGLLLACVGIYAVISYSVAQRLREVGIRLALGAAPGAIRAMVLREGMLLAALGIVGGAAASLALTRYLATMLYTVKPTDPTVFAAVAGILALAAAAGCWFPARRATSVDPAVVLREE